MATEKFDVSLQDRDVRLSVNVMKGGEKTPLVLLHGWPASSAGWKPVAERLPHDRDIYFPDLRGLGDSERKGEVRNFEKREIAEDIRSLVSALDLPRYHVVGQDWGGVVAQELAFDDDRVASLTLMNINLVNNPKGSRKGLMSQLMNPINPRWYMAFQNAPGFAENMLPGNEELWLRYFFSRCAEGNSIPESSISEYIRAYKIEGTPRCGAAFYRAMEADHKRWTEKLANQKQTVPSLIIYGDKDPFIGPEFYEGYEACFDNVRKADVHAGHFVQDERPDDVAREITRFLQSLES
jgi:pimeloyl-ACP methyl ester carboxylesterase